jgi:hypothetical protein
MYIVAMVRAHRAAQDGDVGDDIAGMIGSPGSTKHPSTFSEDASKSDSVAGASMARSVSAVAASPSKTPSDSILESSPVDTSRISPVADNKTPRSPSLSVDPGDEGRRDRAPLAVIEEKTNPTPSPHAPSAQSADRESISLAVTRSLRIDLDKLGKDSSTHQDKTREASSKGKVGSCCTAVQLLNLHDAFSRSSNT